jgi:cardiolipin synthase
VVLSFDHGELLGQIPLWLTGTIIGRDILLAIGLGVIHLMVGKVKVRPRMLGKIATVLQMVCILWILLDWDDLWKGRWLAIWLYGAGICTGLSGLLYVWDGMRQLSASPSSVARPRPGKEN